MNWEYGEAKIELDGAKQFSVFYNGETIGKAYKSWEEATAAIDARQQREERANRVKISVPVIGFDRNDKPIRHVITGIHGGHGRYTAKPPVDQYNVAGLYLDHPVVSGLIEKLRAAREALGQIEAELERFNLSTSDYRRRDLGLDTAEGIEAWRVKKTAEADAIVIRTAEELCREA